MVGSPLLLPALLLLLHPSWMVDCADPATPSITPPPPQVQSWPAFDTDMCEPDTRVFCLLPADAGDKLKRYTNDTNYTPKTTQIIIRYYTDKKMLVEIWSSGDKASLQTKNGNEIFGCTVSGGKVVAQATGETTLLDFGHNTEALYCRFQIVSENTILPGNDVPKITLVTSSMKKYEVSPRELNFWISEEEKSCNVDLISSIASLTNEEHVYEDFSYRDLFRKSISCPSNSVLVFEHVTGKKIIVYETKSIVCDVKEAPDTSLFKMDVKADGANQKTIPKKVAFKAGCRRKVCNMCAPANLACEGGDDCQPPGKETIDDCTVYKCPQSFMVVNQTRGPEAGDIRCTRIKKGETETFDWTFNGNSVVERASCPKKLGCKVVSPLTCAEDQAVCKELDISPSVVLCRDSKLMRVQHGGSWTNVTSLACNEATGKYKMQLMSKTEELLPAGTVVINCTAIETKNSDKGEAATGPKTGQLTMFVAVGSSIGLAIIVLAIVGFFCWRKAQRRKDAASKLPTTTTASKTTLRTTKTMSGESKTPARTVPIPPPTPIAAPLQRAEAEVKPWDPHLTERTPNAPTPLMEQRTQDQPTDRREKSVTKSAPMAEPPTPKAETAQPEEESKSGVESTKKREDRTFRRVEEDEPHLRQVKRRRASSHHHDRSTAHPSTATQGEESTKKTQKDSKTKTKTQRTQDMRTDDATGANDEAAAPRIPSRPPPPKRAAYIAVPDVDKDSYDSEETKKSPIGKGPIKPPAKTPVEQSPYLKLEDMMSEHQQKKKKKEKEETRKTEKDGSVMLVTQDSEESIKKSK